MEKIIGRSAFWRILLPLIPGIIIQFYFRVSFDATYGPAILLLLFTGCCVSLLFRQYVLKYAFGLILFCFSFLSGIVLTSCQLEKSKWEIVAKRHNYSLLLLEDPVIKPKSRMCKARITGCDDTVFTRVAGKNVILYLPLNTETESLRAGHGIIVNTVFKRPEQHGNSTFNYADYLEKKGVAATGYVKENNWIRQPVSFGLIDKIKFKGIEIRNRIVGISGEIFPDEKSASVANALFVGYTKELSPELRSVFAATGTAHILAVSGLHLAILFGLLCFLFSPLNRYLFLVPVTRIFILLVLWFFAFITGLSPSIVRACVMTGFFGMGVVLGRKSFTMNSLAASALFMLIYNPLYLFDVGFQLSYGAVIAIVLINPYLVRLREFKSKILHYFWKLSCVSVAAQVGTAPVSLFYFGQFSVIFLLTNIYAIPLSGLLLILLPLSILLRVIYDFPGYVFIPVKVLLESFISGIEMLNGIPYSAITGLNSDIWQVISFYLGLYLLFSSIKKRQPQYLYALVFLVALQVFLYL
ncbi:MAG: ComEC family competence protein [Dysgonamonadaceae bacterium]|jgi:competence protein ComEC|nr:ComEC family competence protein [Dysgonamonadaceae bacterium]